MELRQYLDIVKRQKWLIIEAVVVVSIVAAVLSNLKTPLYESSARVLLRPNDSAEQLNPGYSGPLINDPDRYVAGQIDIVQSAAVARDAAKLIPNSDPDVILGEVSVSQSGVTDILDVAGTSADPAHARDVANAFAKAYIENRRQYAVASLQAASDELQTKLVQLQGQIATYDTQIGDGGLQPDATTSITPPATGATNPSTAPQNPIQPPALDNGAQPTNIETLKAARYAAATQYTSLFDRQQEIQVDMSLKRGEAELIAEATTPSAPFAPKPKRDGLLGGFVGLLLGLGIAFVREQFDDRIRSSEDAERANGIPVIAELPLDAVASKHTNELVAAIAPHGPTAESTRSLRTSLAFLAIEGPIRRIVVTSPGPGDGKSTLAANLGVVYAQAGHRTVVVSSDLRRPRIDAMFDSERSSEGLTTLLTREAPARASGEGNGNGNGNGHITTEAEPPFISLRSTIVEGLSFLPSGPLPPNPAELLGSQRMDTVLDALSQIADVVILDTPPLLAVTDAAVLAAKSDAVLIVNARGATRRGAARKARDLLDASGVRITGLVLNKVDRSSHTYYGYGDYYQDDMATKANWRTRRRARKAAKKAQALRPAGSSSERSRRKERTKVGAR